MPAKKKKAAKKVVKKRAAKKSVPKKKQAAPKKKTAKQAQAAAAKAAATAMKDIIARARDHFRTAPPEHIFVVADGRTLQDLQDLAEALEDMHEGVFGHHVDDQKHDFANWVEEVLHERALAQQLREAKQHPEQHQRIIYRHIVRRVW